MTEALAAQEVQTAAPVVPVAAVPGKLNAQSDPILKSAEAESLAQATALYD